MAVIEITKDNFEAEVLQSNRPVLLDFWATWCGPCQMQGPIVDEFAEEHTEIKVGKVDVDAQQDLAMQYRVMSIPTIIAFQNGQPTITAVGLQSKESLLQMVSQ